MAQNQMTEKECASKINTYRESNHINADRKEEKKDLAFNTIQDRRGGDAEESFAEDRAKKRSVQEMLNHGEGQRDNLTQEGNNANGENKDKKDDQPMYSLLSMYGDHKRAVSSVTFAPSHWLCGSSSADGTVKIWDVSGLSNPASFSSNNHLVNNGNSTTNNGNSSNASNGTLSSAVQTLVGHARGINHVDWSTRTGEYLATASDDKTCRLWDVSTGEALMELKGHSNFVFSVKFNPQSNLLLSGSFDETLKIWDIRSGTCVSTLPAHSDPVTGVDWNQDGTCCVSGSYDGLIRIWDIATGECLKTIYAEGNPPVSFVKYSPNGKFILSATLDAKLRLWNLGSKLSMDGKCTKTYARSHMNTKYCIFSDFCVANPRQQSVVTGSEDGNVIVYDLQTKAVRQVLSGVHKDAVLAVAAHRKVDLIASGGMTNDKTVRFWASSSVLKNRQ